MMACNPPTAAHTTDTSTADQARRAFVKKSKTGANEIIHIKTSNIEYKMLKSQLTCFYDIPACDAARIMRVCLTLLKRLRVWSGLQRWPYNLVHKGAYEVSVDEIRQLRCDLILQMESRVLSSEEVGFLCILKEAHSFSAAYWRATSVKAVRRDSQVNLMRGIRVDHANTTAVQRALDVRQFGRKLVDMAADMLCGSADAGVVGKKSTDVISTAQKSTDGISTDAISTVQKSTDGISTHAISTAQKSTDGISTHAISTAQKSTGKISTDGISTAQKSTDAISTAPESTSPPLQDTASDLQWLSSIASIAPDHYIVPFDGGEARWTAQDTSQEEYDDEYGLLGPDPFPAQWVAYPDDADRVNHWENVRGWVMNH